MCQTLLLTNTVLHALRGVKSQCFLHFLVSKHCLGHFWWPRLSAVNRVTGLGADVAGRTITVYVRNAFPVAAIGARKLLLLSSIGNAELRNPATILKHILTQWNAEETACWRV